MAYLLDANVFIESRKRYFAFDVCPGFWTWIEEAHAAAKVLSIEKVAEEIRKGKDDLVTWANTRPTGFFIEPDASFPNSFAQVAAWATSGNYDEAAVARFLNVAADAYLVAQAIAGGHTVVTDEKSEKTRSKIKIPDACTALGVTVMSPVVMLRTEGVRFVLPPRPQRR